MFTAKVSLCITVYNREKTLSRCLESAIHQTLEDLEIVIVDDCSTDNSVTIIEKYREIYSQIVFVRNHKNMGPGYSKNKCVYTARGEYISFLDSDDYLDPAYIETIYSAIKNMGIDMAVSQLSMVKSGSCQPRSIYKHNLFLLVNGFSSPVTASPAVIPNIYIAGFFGGASACTKMAKKELWERFPFYEGQRCDDLPAILPMVATVKTIMYFPQCHYHYVQNKCSVERSKSPKKCLDALEAVVKTFYLYEKLHVNKEYQQLLSAIPLFNILQEIFFCYNLFEKPDYTEQIYKMLEPIIKCDGLNHKNNPYLGFQMCRWKGQVLLPLFSLFSQGKLNELATAQRKLRKRKYLAYVKAIIMSPLYILLFLGRRHRAFEFINNRNKKSII